MVVVVVDVVVVVVVVVLVLWVDVVVVLVDVEVEGLEVSVIGSVVGGNQSSGIVMVGNGGRVIVSGSEVSKHVIKSLIFPSILLTFLAGVDAAREMFVLPSVVTAVGILLVVV